MKGISFLLCPSTLGWAAELTEFLSKANCRSALSQDGKFEIGSHLSQMWFCASAACRRAQGSSESSTFPGQYLQRMDAPLSSMKEPGVRSVNLEIGQVGSPESAEGNVRSLKSPCTAFSTAC